MYWKEPVTCVAADDRASFHASGDVAVACETTLSAAMERECSDVAMLSSVAACTDMVAVVVVVVVVVLRVGQEARASRVACDAGNLFLARHDKTDPSAASSRMTQRGEGG